MKKMIALSGKNKNLKETWIRYHILKKSAVMEVFLKWIIAGAGAGAENVFFFGSGGCQNEEYNYSLRPQFTKDGESRYNSLLSYAF